MSATVTRCIVSIFLLFHSSMFLTRPSGIQGNHSDWLTRFSIVLCLHSLLWFDNSLHTMKEISKNRPTLRWVHTGWTLRNPSFSCDLKLFSTRFNTGHSLSVYILWRSTLNFFFSEFRVLPCAVYSESAVKRSSAAEVWSVPHPPTHHPRSYFPGLIPSLWIYKVNKK